MANNTGQKYGGRQAGTQNVFTKELREKFSLLIQDNYEKLQKDIDMLEPKDRLKIIIEISKFVIPSLKATEYRDLTENEFTPIIIKFSE